MFLPGESHGQKSLADHSPWGCQESDESERLTLSRLLSRNIKVLTCKVRDFIISVHVMVKSEIDFLKLRGLVKK